MTSPAQLGTCEQCGEPLPAPSPTGRPRHYCGPTCRSAARRARIREAGARGEATGQAPDVHVSLTPERSKGIIDALRGETGGGSDPAAEGQEAAHGILGRWLSGGSGSTLAGIAFAQGAVSAMDDGLQQMVQRARDAGHTWAEVGQVLGITRQAAFQRFGRPVDPRTGEPMRTSMLPGAADRAAALFADLAAGRWSGVCRDFDEHVASKLDADGVARVWAQLRGMAGWLEKMGKPVAYQAGDYTVVDLPLTFEAGERTGRVSYDRNGKVAGLFFLPPGHAG